MAELSPKNNRNGAEQASSSSDVPAIPDGAKHSVVIEMLQHIKDLEFNPSEEYKLERVPEKFRRDEGIQKYFNPSVVSLGPYHHGKLEFQFTENLKYMILEAFVSSTGKKIDDFYNKVVEVIRDVRSYYIEGSTDAYDDNAFSKMMLLDGCLILYRIALALTLQYRSISDKVDLYLDISTWADVQRDLFLLENQIPFLVLQVLMSLIYGEVDGEKLINTYLNNLLFGEHQHQRSKLKLTAGEDENWPLHLLDACRMKLLHRCDEVGQSSHTQRHKKKLHGYSGRKQYFHSFRSVTELKAKGIHLRRSSTESLKDIKFKSFCFYGNLELPTFLLTPRTGLIFFNLIAYEMCTHNRCDFGVTHYISFMKSLINHPGDVKELRSKNILYSSLGSDEEVVSMYNQIGRCTFKRGLYAYLEVSERIQTHYNSKMRTWIAELIYKYFSSPWTLFAFLAATSLLVLSFVQTYFAIFPRSGK